MYHYGWHPVYKQLLTISGDSFIRHQYAVIIRRSSNLLWSFPYMTNFLPGTPCSCPHPEDHFLDSACTREQVHTPDPLLPLWGAAVAWSARTAGRSFILWCLRTYKSKVLIIPVPHLDYSVRHLSKRGMWVLKWSEGREGVSRTQDKLLRLHTTRTCTSSGLLTWSLTLISLNRPVTASCLGTEAENTHYPL